MSDLIDVAIVGAGAAGLMAAIAARRADPTLRVVALDGAQRLGAKILISGGGRCNVTHHSVSAADFCGGSQNTIRKVLRAFDVDDTVAFFDDLGVALHVEETGKLFPDSNRARTVLEALLAACDDAGVALQHPFRVETLETCEEGFEIGGPHGTLVARNVVMATGGQSVVQTGSDGHGYRLAQGLGHGLTRPLLPALVPLLLPDDHPICELAGVSAPVRLTLVSAAGRRIEACEGSLLCTHFGISGPVTLDMSRHLLAAREQDAGCDLEVCWLPRETEASLDQALRKLGPDGPLAWLQEHLPVRLARMLCAEAHVDPDEPGAQLTRGGRRSLVRTCCAQPLSILGPRGWPYAEVTAGGIPLTEVDVRTMASRVCPGLYLCGEILDVDGRIGGFNFQWAWATGHLAGRGAAASET